jgi:hypothetical protein
VKPIFLVVILAAVIGLCFLATQQHAAQQKSEQAVYKLSPSASAEYLKLERAKQDLIEKQRYILMGANVPDGMVAMLDSDGLTVIFVKPKPSPTVPAGK